MGVRDVWQGFRARWRGGAARPRARFSSGFEGDLARFVDRFISGQTGAVTREQALSVPAFVLGRNKVCSIGTLPLVLNAPDGSRVQPGSDHPGAATALWLSQIDPDVVNVVTLSQTVEDLLFDGIAWWEISGYGWDGYPVAARRVAPSSVSLTPPPGSRRQAPLPSGKDPRGASVWIDGREVSARDVIRFDSPNPGALTAGARAIRKAILVAQLAAMYSENPRPLDYFQTAEQFEEPADEDTKKFLAKWASNRARSSTGWVPKWAKYEQVEAPSPAELQLVELMKQSGLEIANMFGLDPEELGVSTTSRTYANVNDRRQDKLNEVLSPYMLAITQRLSVQGNVTKRGYTVWFDLRNYLKSNPTERVAYYKAMRELGVMDAEMISQAEGFGPLPAKLQQQREPIQAEVVDPQEVTDGSEQGDQGEAEAQPAIAGAKAGQAAQWQFRRGGPAVTLARGPEHGSYDFEFDGCAFTFDAETRMVEGLALPYGKQAGKYGYKFRFNKGSLEWGDVSRVKITVDHWDAVGVATYVADKKDGYQARGRIARGPEGDALLMKAEDGVYDGMSVGVDFDLDLDTVPDPKFKDDPMARLVMRATLREIAVTAMPAFDDARLTSVKASTNAPEEEITVPDIEPTTTAPAEPAPVTTPAPAAPVAPAAAEPTSAPAPAQFAAAPAGSVTLTAEQFSQLLARGAAPAPAAQVEQQPAPAQFAERTVVDPTRPIPGQQPRPTAAVTVTRNPLAYRFDRRGVVVDETDVDVAEGRHSFGRDLRTMWAYRDEEGKSEAGKRVFAALAGWDKAIRTRFANTASSDVNELFPTKTLDYREAPGFFTPLWQMIDKGTLPNGVQPFIPPTMSKSSTTIAVGTHTEGTEPTATKYVTTGDTITPVPLTAKVSMTRVAWDTVTGLDSLAWVEINNQYYKTLDDRAATFLATLTAADNISLDGLTHIALQDLWESAYIHLQQGRRYNFTALALEEALFKAFNAARENSGAGNKLYPRLSPTNAMGTVAERFGSIDLNGVQGIMCAALGTANSWLFDPAYVVGLATPPQRLQFSEGIGTASDGSFAPVAMIDMAVWGYHAEYCWDTDAVKEITYNNAS